MSLDEFYNSNLKDCVGVIDIQGFIEDLAVKKVDLQIHFVKVICVEAFRLVTIQTMQTALMGVF